MALAACLMKLKLTGLSASGLVMTSYECTTLVCSHVDSQHGSSKMTELVAYTAPVARFQLPGLALIIICWYVSV